MFKKYFAGGLTVSAALAPLAAATPVHAAPAHSPQQAPALPGDIDPSTLGSCSADFGLSKALISFDETITGSATPVPHVGNGIIPVVTFIDGASEVSCILQLAWTDEASFLVALDNPPAGLFPYPGGGYYIAPAFDDFLPSGAMYRIDLFLQAPHTDVWSIAWTADLSFPLFTSPEELFGAVFDRVRNSLPAEVQPAWDELGFDIITDTCPTIDDPALAAALLALAGGQEVIDEYSGISDPDCVVLTVVFVQALWDVLLRSGTVPVSLSSGTGESGAAVPDPVVGSSPTPLLVTATAFAALGTGLVFAGRRRRQPA
ncbi:MAG: hypothetical protein Q7V57_08185 [Actinomycetota bacterium]|nr:hypothetical protein [Actinomycetota bacterium]